MIRDKQSTFSSVTIFGRVLKRPMVLSAAQCQQQLTLGVDVSPSLVSVPVAYGILASTVSLSSASL